MDVDLSVTDNVGWVEIRRGPNNFFSHDLVAELGDAYERCDADDACRVIVLCSEGRHFCAGADFSDPRRADFSTMDLYRQARRLVANRKPVIAAVQGAAIGGGLGLACSADFRVGCPQSRLSANFARLGFHQGFGLTVTLPRIVGQQQAAELLYTGRRLDGAAALAIGLVDRLASDASTIRDVAAELATEIALSAPLAVESIRATMRADLVAGFGAATEHEAAEQERLRATEDFAEGVRATAAREPGNFKRR